ncbi:MAG: BamA/TamA family outer membrane protein [Bacteroidia bacterium]
MRYKKSGTLLFLSVAIILMSACSNTRFLKDDQVLYSGRGKVTIVNKKQIKNSRLAEDLTKRITFVKPNNALFGNKRVLPPFGLWTHNYLGPKKEGKKPGWFYRNFSREPVLVSQINPEKRCREIESALFSIGFLNSKASFTVDTNRRNTRKAKISYTIQIDTAFRINNIFNTRIEDPVDSIIKSYTEKMDIKPGDLFNIEAIKSEKRNISAVLVEQGYYFFGPDNIKFIADTSTAPYQIDLMIGKSPETPLYVCKKYSIDHIKVNLVGVQVDSSDKTIFQDTVFQDGVIITGLKNYLKPGVITRCIQFRKGDLYTTSKHQGTIRQLNNYGIFKYVKMQFTVQDSLHQVMDLTIEMSPKNDVSLNLEGFVQSKSTGFAGPGIETTLAHGNIGKQANKLQLKLGGGVEWQWGINNTDQIAGNSYNAGINASFEFPRLVLPFKLPSSSKLISSKTICNLGFEFTNNVQFYRMNGVNLGFSYLWKRRQKITNIFFPLKINVVNLLKTTSEFDSIAESNPYVKKSFEEQTIIGTEYNFTYDNSNKKSNGFYFQSIIGTAGNLIDLVKSAQGGKRPYTIIDNVYSQFIKSSVDVRYYTATVKKGIVFRFYTGAGFSYSNSAVMPYVEQFYSGGSMSLRGFQARSLGPGSYEPDQSSGIVDQTGDIKLEANVEYRFQLSKLVLGALFVDAGNVWLLNKDVNRPAAEFGFNTFARQIAVGTGVGLRFDFSFFILRTDLGFPLRNTYQSDNSYWIRNVNDALSGAILNIAIGFPF